MDWLTALTGYRRYYKRHALYRMLQRDIEFADVDNALRTAQVIEEYVDDKPFPSCLVLGVDSRGMPLHLVVAVDVEEESSYIVTVYRPAPEKWQPGFKKRK